MRLFICNEEEEEEEFLKVYVCIFFFSKYSLDDCRMMWKCHIDNSRFFKYLTEIFGSIIKNINHIHCIRELHVPVSGHPIIISQFKTILNCLSFFVNISSI